MKVFFSTTTHKIEKHGERYYKIREHLIDSGATILHDWLGDIKRTKGQYIIPEKISGVEYKKTRNAIDKSDVVIFENTIQSFSTGHLMTLALQKKIPTLVMWLDSSPLAKRQGMIESIDSNYLELAEYNMRDYKELLNRFINKYGDPEVKHRFNLVIDDSERQYLDWLNVNSFDSRTKIIRDLIREQLDEDEVYQRYLSKNSRNT